MSNRMRGESTLVVSGQTYTLVFNNNAMCALEGLLNESWTDFMERMKDKKVWLRDIRALLWAELRARHGSVTLEQAGDILSEDGDEATTRCMEAFSRAFPTPDAGNVEAAHGTGAQPLSPPPSQG